MTVRIKAEARELLERFFGKVERAKQQTLSASDRDKLLSQIDSLSDQSPDEIDVAEAQVAFDFAADRVGRCAIAEDFYLRVRFAHAEAALSKRKAAVEVSLGVPEADANFRRADEVLWSRQNAKEAVLNALEKELPLGPRAQIVKRSADIAWQMQALSASIGTRAASAVDSEVLHILVVGRARSFLAKLYLPFAMQHAADQVQHLYEREQNLRAATQRQFEQDSDAKKMAQLTALNGELLALQTQFQALPPDPALPADKVATRNRLAKEVASLAATRDKAYALTVQREATVKRELAPEIAEREKAYSGLRMSNIGCEIVGEVQTLNPHRPPAGPTRPPEFLNEKGELVEETPAPKATRQCK